MESLLRTFGLFLIAFALLMMVVYTLAAQDLVTGNEYYKQERYQEAKKVFESYLSKAQYPAEKATGWFRVGMCELALGDSLNAVTHIHNSLLFEDRKNVRLIYYKVIISMMKNSSVMTKLFYHEITEKEDYEIAAKLLISAKQYDSAERLIDMHRESIKYPDSLLDFIRAERITQEMLEIQ